MRSSNSPRIPHDASVEFGTGAHARAVNLSTGGTYVATPEVLEPGETVQLKVDLRDGHEPLDAEAEVVWRGREGMALRWTSLQDSARRRIQRLVERQEPTPFARRDVRIRLPSLSAPLRASARDLTDQGIMIEAELPWLQLGTPVTAELSPERSCAGRMQWIGLDVTKEGAARLRLFVNLRDDQSNALPALAAPPRARGRSMSTSYYWLRSGLALSGWLAAAALGWALVRPIKPLLLPVVSNEVELPAAPPRPLLIVIPKAQPAVAAESIASSTSSQHPGVMDTASPAKRLKRILPAQKRTGAKKKSLVLKRRVG
jgi:hypothetical protein